MTARPSWREIGGLAAAVLAVVSLLLPWTVLSADDPAVRSALAELPAEDVTRSVWRATFFGWFPPLLVAALGATVAAVGRINTARMGGLPQLWLIGACLALLAAVLGWLLADWQFGSEERAVLEAGGVTVEAGIGRYLGALAAVASVVFAALDTRALHTETRRNR
ncbi:MULTISPECIES: hypothetical protein [Prauserella salsuginis group]|uniref:Uncharacterized protein n=2 Tax=Prauserella salsuginis group TaxID=2893672 RepID=A0A839XNJ8_9PSEU|nr:MULTISPECIES: hypothetical protein [Prauserella salsuginis group]MBB3661505.1 hypothetical protein [Prauserella sediminis]MCR3719424.1 hypothetical protein [Prauserella flava]MCR3735562.1 hypothetical protein [Prauserella salsuginis]